MTTDVTKPRQPDAIDLPPSSETVSVKPPEPAGEPVGMYKSAALQQAMGTYLPATVAFRLINFGRILLLTWFMTRQQFGLLTMILLVLNVLTPLCSLGLNEAITRYVPQYETQGRLVQFLRRSLTLLAGVTAFSVLLMIVFSSSLGDFFYAQVTDEATRLNFGADAPQLAQLSAIVIGLLIMYFYLLAVLKGLRMFGALARLELSHSLLFLAGAVLAVLTRHLSAFTLTAMYGVSMALPIAYYGVGMSRVMAGWQAQSQLLPSGKLAAKLLRFSIWTTLAGVTWQVLVYYPQWFLNKVHGHEAVAVFGAVRQIGQFILVGAVSVSTVVMTMVTKTWESRGREAAERQLSLAIRGTGLGLLVLCGGIALTRNLIMAMFRPEYAPGGDILPLQLLFFLLGAFLAFLPGHFHLQEKTRHMFWPWAVGVAANVLYAFWLANPAKLAIVRALPWWKTAADYSMGFFAIGFSDAQGLHSATWCGVFAIFTALVLCVVLIRAECNRLDRGTYVVIGASLLLAARPWILAVGLVLLVVAAFRSTLIFTADERRRILGHVFGSLRHLRKAAMAAAVSLGRALLWKNRGKRDDGV